MTTAFQCSNSTPIINPSGRFLPTYFHLFYFKYLCNYESHGFFFIFDGWTGQPSDRARRFLLGSSVRIQPMDLSWRELKAAQVCTPITS